MIQASNQLEHEVCVCVLVFNPVRSQTWWVKCVIISEGDWSHSLFVSSDAVRVALHDFQIKMSFILYLTLVQPLRACSVTCLPFKDASFWLADPCEQESNCSSLHWQAGFPLIQVSSGLTQNFLYREDGSLQHVGLCCRPSRCHHL